MECPSHVLRDSVIGMIRLTLIDKYSVYLADLVLGRSLSERCIKQFASPDRTMVRQKRIGRFKKIVTRKRG